MTVDSTDTRIPMLPLLRDREFRALTIAQFLSIIGDQLARVALTVLVFNRTNSPLEAAVAYALSFVPSAIGGPLLSGLADRRPRRWVLISADLVRVPLIAAMAIPHIPLALAMTLIGIAALLEAPFNAARGALLPDVLPGERYPTGYAFGQIVSQSAQVGGYGLAGILLIALSPPVLLLLDAGSFVFSAALLARHVAARPAASVTSDEPSATWWRHALRDARISLNLVLRTSRLRALALLAWATSLFTVGFEALGAPLARDSGSATWTVGVLLAAQPAGTVCGAVLAARVPSRHRPAAMRVLALMSVTPLIFGLLHPPVQVLVIIGVLSGVGISFNVIASTAFVAEVAADVRGRALGLVGAGLLAGQGLGVLLAGGFASWIGARVALGWLGTAGAVAILLVLWDGTRARQTAPSD